MTNSKDETDQVELQPKSKRLSSCIWLLLLCVLIRAMSELNHPYWYSHIWSIVTLFSGIPTGSLLLCAALFPLRCQSTLRWAALGAFIFNFFLISLFVNKPLNIQIKLGDFNFSVHKAFLEYCIIQFLYTAFAIILALTQRRLKRQLSWLIQRKPK